MEKGLYFSEVLKVGHLVFRFCFAEFQEDGRKGRGEGRVTERETGVRKGVKSMGIKQKLTAGKEKRSDWWGWRESGGASWRKGGKRE